MLKWPEFLKSSEEMQRVQHEKLKRTSISSTDYHIIGINIEFAFILFPVYLILITANMEPYGIVSHNNSNLAVSIKFSLQDVNAIFVIQNFLFSLF